MQNPFLRATGPTSSQLKASGLIELPPGPLFQRLDEDATALENGWPLYTWNDLTQTFHPIQGRTPITAKFYASPQWKSPRIPPVVPPVPTPTPAPIFTAVASSPTIAKVSWANFAPVSIGRDGTDSNGTGPWSTTNVVGASSWTFGSLIPGDTYTYTAKDSLGVTLVFILAQPAVPTPAPTPASNASGIPIPPAPAGLKLLFVDDFTTTTRDTTIWTPAYSGKSEGGVEGQFGGESHVKQPGDSTLRLLAFTDPGVSSAQYNFWAGGGLGAWAKPMAVGSEVYVCMKADFVPKFSPIALTIGAGHWGPEGDFAELTGSDFTQFTGTRIEGVNGSNNQPQQRSPITDLTKWHVYGQRWHTDKIEYTLDGQVWATWVNDSAPGDVNGWAGPTLQVLCLQFQANPSTPDANPSITASNPYAQIVDWVVAYAP